MCAVLLPRYHLMIRIRSPAYLVSLGYIFPLDYNADIHEDQYVKFYGRLVLYILTLCLIRLRDKLLIQEENHTLRGLEFDRSL